MTAAGTGLVFHERYLTHDPGPMIIGSARVPYPYSTVEPHVEHPQRVARIKELVDLSGLGAQLTPVAPWVAEAEDVGLFHTRDYIRHVLELSVTATEPVDAGAGARMSAGGYEVALLAAGGGIAAVDAVLNGKVRNSYALVRPPGHHAVADKGMGFCIFNNVAVAALHALSRNRAERVLIVDWDVHHGNGTQEAFYRSRDVLFVSLHQDNLYPENSGLVAQVGEGKGEGYTLNVPLPAGSGDAAYVAAFEQLIVPIAKQYKPDLVLVSSGLDASMNDPLGRMVLSAAGYRKMLSYLLELATDFAGGRLAVMHEGGYNQSYAPFCGLAIIEELAGIRTELSALPDQARFDRYPAAHTVGLDAEQVMRRIREVQGRYWQL